MRLQDLLFFLVDSVLDQFISNLGNWDFFLADPEEELNNTFLWKQKSNHPEEMQVPAGSYYVKGVTPPGGGVIKINNEQFPAIFQYPIKL